MRGDLEVTDARTVWQDHRHGRLGATVAAPGFEEVRDGAGAQRVAREGDLDGGGQFLRSVVLEERKQPDQMRPEHVAARGQARQEGRRDRHGQTQAVAGAGRIGLVGGREEPLDMRRILDGLGGVVTPRMSRDLVGTRDDPDGGRAGEQRERTADVRVGNRVAVAIEADVRQFAGDDGPHQLGLEGMRGQRQEPRLLLREDLRDGLVALLGVRALMGDLVPPALKLRIEIVHIAKRPGGEEGVPQIADLALDFALLIAARRGTGPDRKMIMPCEVEEPRMKPDRGPVALKDGRLQVVVHQGPGDAQYLEGHDVAAQKALEGLVQGEVREEGARVRQDHHETGEGPRAVADPERPERAPIDLRHFIMGSFP